MGAFTGKRVVAPVKCIYKYLSACRAVESESSSPWRRKPCGRRRGNFPYYYITSISIYRSIYTYLCFYHFFTHLFLSLFLALYLPPHSYLEKNAGLPFFWFIGVFNAKTWGCVQRGGRGRMQQALTPLFYRCRLHGRSKKPSATCLHLSIHNLRGRPINLSIYLAQWLSSPTLEYGNFRYNLRERELRWG